LFGLHFLSLSILLPAMNSNPTLGSVGSLIIDDIVFQDGSKQLNVIGGAGIFAIYGEGFCTWLKS
jgi:hypothetical protein